MNWYIRQEIICIYKQPRSVLKYNQIYTIRGISKCLCGCNYILLDIGLIAEYKQSCARCCLYSFGVGVWWFDENCFAPLDTLEEQIKEALTTSIEI